MQSQELNNLILSYGNHDVEFKQLKKVCDSEKESLKNIMGEIGSEKESYGGFTITRTVSERESFNEQQALAILKQSWYKNHGYEPCPFVKTVEVLDSDALESAMYNGELDNNTILKLDECRSVTEVITLKCSKSKGAK